MTPDIGSWIRGTSAEGTSSKETVSGEKNMKMKEALKFALTGSDRAVLSVIDEMAAAPTTFPTPNGGCHPLWVLGHLTFVEGMIPQVLFGKKNPVSEWQSYFGEDAEPVGDPSSYPSFAALRAKYSELRGQNLKILDSLSEEDLDKPTQAPPKGREHEFATYGKSFLVLALHQMMHRSHVTDARRAARSANLATVSS
jgi:hypothetical protein